MNTGANDKYTTEKVQKILTELIDEFDVFDDEFIIISNASMAFTDDDLRLALNQLANSPNDKLKKIGSELLAKWQPEVAGLPPLANPPPLPSPPRKEAHAELLQNLAKVNKDTVGDEDPLDALDELVQQHEAKEVIKSQKTLIERLATMQNMILQSMQPDSDYAKWMQSSEYAERVKSFGNKLRQVLPPNDYHSFATALRNIDVNKGVMLKSLFDQDNFKAVRQLYAENIQFLEELNQAFQSRATAQKVPASSSSTVAPQPESKITIKNPNKPLPTIPVSQVSPVKKSQLVIGNLLDNPERNIIVDPAHERTMNGNGGVSGAIKAMYEQKGLLKSYIKDLLHFPKVGGKRCPNGEVKHTFTGGVDVIHTSAPDLREKQNLKAGSKTAPSDEAKEKLYQSYYNAFRMAYNLNANAKGPNSSVKEPKAINSPILGSGIFKWPAEMSAEVAGRAIKDFRAKFGNELQINLFMRPQDLTADLTQEKLQAAIDKGSKGVRFAPPPKDVAHLQRNEPTAQNTAVARPLPATPRTTSTSTATVSSASQPQPQPTPSPVKLDGVKEAKLRFIDTFIEKITKLNTSLGDKQTRIKMLTELNKYVESTDVDIKAKATEVLAHYNQQERVQSPEPQVALPLDLKVPNQYASDFKLLADVSINLLEDMFASKEFDKQNDSQRNTIINIGRLLRPLHSKIENFGKGDINLGEVIDFLKTHSNIPNAQNVNPLQVLADGIAEIAKSLNVEQTLKTRLQDVREKLVDMSKQLNLPFSSEAIQLQQKTKPQTSSGSSDFVSALSSVQNINVKEMYEQERRITLSRTSTLNAFARNAIKRIGHMKNADRDNQIAGLQVLVNRVNEAKDPEAKNEATRELVLALSYLKNEINKNKKTISLASALDAVCDKILARIPNSDSYNSQERQNQFIGQEALNNAIPEKVETKSKGKPK